MPATETGEVVLIGATTENPYFEVNAALMSRSTLWRLHPLTDERSRDPRRSRPRVARRVDHRGRAARDRAPPPTVTRAAPSPRSTPRSSWRDWATTSVVDVAHVARARDGRLYHQSADTHYDQISAFIKSVRGSDPDAALYWMVTMLESGESPRFLARRLVILASEDIGLADPMGLRGRRVRRAGRRVHWTARGAPDPGARDGHSRADAQEQLGDPCAGRGYGRGARGPADRGARLTCATRTTAAPRCTGTARSIVPARLSRAAGSTSSTCRTRSSAQRTSIRSNYGREKAVGRTVARDGPTAPDQDEPPAPVE